MSRLEQKTKNDLGLGYVTIYMFQTHSEAGVLRQSVCLKSDGLIQTVYLGRHLGAMECASTPWWSGRQLQELACNPTVQPRREADEGSFW